MLQGVPQSIPRGVAWCIPQDVPQGILLSVPRSVPQSIPQGIPQAFSEEFSVSRKPVIWIASRWLYSVQMFDKKRTPFSKVVTAKLGSWY